MSGYMAQVLAALVEIMGLDSGTHMELTAVCNFGSRVSYVFFLVSVGTRYTHIAVHAVCALNFSQTSGAFTIDVTLSIGPFLCFSSVETESHYVTLDGLEQAL